MTAPHATDLPPEHLHADVAVIGAGPAGLMVADELARAGRQVHLFDAMPSVGRKFLLAGRGGLNLTHSESRPAFDQRYEQAAPWVGTWLDGLDGPGLQAWAAELGVKTFVGTSGRVFPQEMKAAPLLRAWVHRLRHPGGGGVSVQFHMRHRWTGWSAGALVFQRPEGPVLQVHARVTVLALGGASWARLGSDGVWVSTLRAQGVAVADLQPANCGFDAWGRSGQGWTAHFAGRHAGQPLKSVAIALDPPAPTHGGHGGHGGHSGFRKGEFVVTATGVEGSLIYTASARLREALRQDRPAVFWLDLLPDRSLAQVQAEVARPRGSRSWASHLKGRLGLQGVKMGLLHELVPPENWLDPGRLALQIKALPLRLRQPRPIDEAISSAGGVRQEALTESLMLKNLPGVYCAGEMLDWEAPTGGYLLTACLASGRQVARQILKAE